MPSTKIRPSYSFFSNAPVTERRFQRSFSVIQLDVEIPDYQPISSVSVYVHHINEADKDTTWRRTVAALVGRYPESATTFLYSATIEDTVSAWYAVGKWGKGRPDFFYGSRSEPNAVPDVGPHIVAPPYFTVGFASISKRRDDSTIWVATNPSTLRVGDGDVIALMTTDGWKTQREVPCTRRLEPVIRSAAGEPLATWSVKLPSAQLTRNFEVCFKVSSAGTVFWDNNYGVNYKLRRGFSELRSIWPFG